MYLYIAGRVFSFRGETLKRPSYKGHVCRVSTILIYYLFVFKICLVTVYVCAHKCVPIMLLFIVPCKTLHYTK